MTRRFINSFKRAFNNPGRTVGTLLIIALIAATYGGPLFMQYHEQIKPFAAAQLLPPLELVASILTLMVCGYLLFSFFLSIDYTHAFTEHDVLNVFPTPLPRKLVFQFFLYTRGLLASTLAIVLIAYFFFRTSRSLLFSIHRDGRIGHSRPVSFCNPLYRGKQYTLDRRSFMRAERFSQADFKKNPLDTHRPCASVVSRRAFASDTLGHDTGHAVCR